MLYLLNVLTFLTYKIKSYIFLCKYRTPALHCAFIHITPDNRDLMEFFDEPKNWGRNEVKVGRSWRKDELRLKSNSDLHKLW